MLLLYVQVTAYLLCLVRFRYGRQMKVIAFLYSAFCSCAVDFHPINFAKRQRPNRQQHPFIYVFFYICINNSFFSEKLIPEKLMFPKGL